MGRVLAGQQVRKLARLQDKRGGFVENADDYRFRIFPTCPPSTSIHFQGGLLWWPEYSIYPAGFFIPSYTVDLTDTDKVTTPFKFTTPYWYVSALIGIDQYIWPIPEDGWPTSTPDDIVYWYRSSIEYETAEEAEVAAMELRGQVAIYYGHNMGGIILRNNGNTTEYNQFMVVDPINRGHSYLFGKKRYGWELA